LRLTITKKDVENWLEYRFGFNKLIDLAREKMVPHHRYSVAYYLGGAILFLTIIQIITGILLLFNYKASAESAHQSVTQIMTTIPFGWLIRSVHHWGSNLMILILFAHLFSTMLMKSYRKPRELTWFTGFALFLISLILGYSGYLLPWDERAFFAVKVGSQMPAPIPLIGENMRSFLRGGDQIGEFTLNRFFALHVGLMPWLLVVVMALHLVFVQIQGMSVPLGIEEKARKNKKKIPARPFFSYDLFQDFSNWAILLGIIVTLAIIYPASLEGPADMLKPAPKGVKPDWFFLAVFQTLRIIPTTVFGFSGEAVGIIATTIAAIFFMFMPVFDRKTAHDQKSPVFTAIAWFTLSYFIIMSVWGYYS
jgi:quinol-cytochrome oxidoreductase complex cytochrome b subunit